MPTQELGKDMASEIMVEVSRALVGLGAQPELLSIVGSFRDTLDDDEILDMLRSYNAHGTAMASIKCCVKVGSEECTYCGARGVCTLNDSQETSDQGQEDLKSL